MKTQSQLQNILSLLFILVSLNGFSQTVDKSNLTTLQNVVENIKQKNESIKNVESVNVMVNDVLIKDLQDFTIDPKSIAMVEVLVLKPKADGAQIKPSIIINTKPR
ncbi:hypothetical protein [Flavobacterium wongokense]|uniref:hypothetical protein n=1 Tax=Flavobacterium wongokense TaxID=2910674 RepID=UPI001F1DD930|nr:hypothetical protein [Flavobacterium sp. WG47]MCF6132893.1 hypothetical protein [Flavobacterium sp. WG47]